MKRRGPPGPCVVLLLSGCCAATAATEESNAVTATGTDAVNALAAADAAAVTEDQAIVAHGAIAGNSLPDGDLFLAVSINGAATGTLVHFRLLRGQLHVSGADLEELGIQTASLGIAGKADVILDALPGVRYRYDAAGQTVDLQLPDAIRKAYAIDPRGISAARPSAPATGLLLNYDALATDATGSRAQLSLWNELRWFNASGVFSNTGMAVAGDGEDSYRRFDTVWTHSNPGTLAIWRLGDTLSSSLDWSRSIHMAGLQWSSDFALRPDLVTFPVPVLTGSSVAPSSVELYINSVRQYAGNVPAGPFIVNAVPGITGAGQATIVTHDALGRAISTSVPIYIDSRLLAGGLTSYSVEAGFLRRNYGLDSFDYAASPSASASVRHGVNDAFTIEAHAEGTAGTVDAGAGALLRLGQAGVLNGSFAARGGTDSGTQAGFGYQLVERYFSVSAQTLRTFGQYGDIATRLGAPVPSVTDRLTLALSPSTWTSVSASYIGYQVPQQPDSRIGQLSWMQILSHSASFTANVFHDFARHEWGAFLSINISLQDRTSFNVTAGEQDHRPSYAANAVRTPDYDGGWGWGAQVGHASGYTYEQAQGEYLGRYGEITAAVQELDGRTSGSLDASGALVLMDGTVIPARRIYDAFTLVSTSGEAGIPVLHENRIIGDTDATGHLLIPDLNAWQHNAIAIDPLGLPADARVEQSRLDVVPQTGSGALAKFTISRYRAATLILQDPGGVPLPVGARVRIAGSDAETVVGYDGLAFIEDLKDDNRLAIDYDGRHCTLEFHFQAPRDHSLPTLGPLRCVAAPVVAP